MSGLTGLVDTLMADKLVQRTDLVRLPSAEVVPGLTPAVAVQAVSNDTRVHSDAARQRLFFGEGDPGTRPRVTLPPLAPDLSAAARAISAVLADLAAESATVEAARPLVPAMAEASAALPLAQALAAAVRESGLFYEAHLAALATGGFELDELRHEPQAQWRLAHTPTSGATAAVSSHDAAPAPRSTGAEFTGPAARALVSQQLDLLATGTFAWKGEAWPGVPLHWRIGRDDAQRHQAEGESSAPWWTTLSLQMPRLGAVTVRLSLAGRRLRASFGAEASAMTRLHAAAQELGDTLRLAGIELQPFGAAEGTTP